MEPIRFKVKKGTTRELVSFCGVLAVVAACGPDEGERGRAAESLQEIMGGGYTRPTGTGDELRTGRRLAAVVAQRTVERGLEGGALGFGDALIVGMN